ncbi:MAG TPA: acetoacetate decarboxylase family protein [Acidimicrobiia bacterium]|nr:acetoacetate decarboxylase family protein [Acidimicrobiia bacterium]
MPDYGLVTAEDLGPTTPQLAPLYPALPWEMPGARLVKLAYEVDLGFMRRTLPAGLARSTPPYGTLLVTDVPESPFGPFRLAAQTLACRYRNYARVYVLQAVVDNPVALAALREVWSYPAAPGTVELTSPGAGPTVSGAVSTPSGLPLAVFEITEAEGADAERIVIDGELTARVPARFASEAASEAEPVRLVQLNRAYALRDARRGRFTVRFSDGGDAYPWGAVPVTNTIIAVDTQADLEFAPTDHVLSFIPET